MSDLHLTRHGETRMRQRGYRNADLDLVLSSATCVADDAFLLTNRDAAREIARRKREIQQLERDTLITLYHAAAKPRKSRGQQ